MNTGKLRHLSQNAARHYILKKEPLPTPSPLTPELARQKACYVAMYENPGRRLRAAFGTPLPTTGSLAAEIIRNTVKALEQPRDRIRQADLRDLLFEIAVIGPLERISGPEHLNPVHFGLYIRSDREKSAVVLPQRTGVETAEDQVATAIRESGINLRIEAATLYRFSVTYDE